MHQCGSSYSMLFIDLTQQRKVCQIDLNKVQKQSRKSGLDSGTSRRGNSRRDKPTHISLRPNLVCIYTGYRPPVF